MTVFRLPSPQHETRRRRRRVTPGTWNPPTTTPPESLDQPAPTIQASTEPIWIALGLFLLGAMFLVGAGLPESSFSPLIAPVLWLFALVIGASFIAQRIRQGMLRVVERDTRERLDVEDHW